MKRSVIPADAAVFGLGNGRSKFGTIPEPAMKKPRFAEKRGGNAEGVPGGDSGAGLGAGGEPIGGERVAVIFAGAGGAAAIVVKLDHAQELGE